MWQKSAQVSKAKKKLQIRHQLLVDTDKLPQALATLQETSATPKSARELKNSLQESVKESAPVELALKDFHERMSSKTRET